MSEETKPEKTKRVAPWDAPNCANTAAAKMIYVVARVNENLEKEEKEGLTYEAKNYDALLEEMTGPLCKVGLVMFGEILEYKQFVVGDGPKKTTQAHCLTKVTIMDPVSGHVIESTGFGTGVHRQDKADGVAQTYAAKSALTRFGFAFGEAGSRGGEEDCETPVKSTSRGDGRKVPSMSSGARRR